MRTLFLTLNVMLTGIIVFVSCQKTAPSTTTEATVSRPCPECTDHSRTIFKGISTQTAWDLSQDYKIMNQPKLEIDETYTDANSIWFSAESLKNFLWKVEEAICRKGCAENLKLGLRIYYARYPNAAGMAANPDLSDLDPAFQQHHTLFMVPTYQDGLNQQVHHDFDPWHWGDKACEPKPMEQWFATGPKPFGNEKSLIFSLNENQYFKSAGGGLTPAMNHGNMIPPSPDLGTGY